MFEDVLRRIVNLIGKDEDVEVFGIPTSGLPYAEEVARCAERSMTIVPVVKLRMTSLPFIGLGALSAGSVLLNTGAINSLQVGNDVEAAIMDANGRLGKIMSLIATLDPRPPRDISMAIIVDDAIATGYTTQCTTDWIVERYHPQRLIYVCDVIDEKTEEILKSEGKIVMYGQKRPSHDMQRRRTGRKRIFL